MSQREAAKTEKPQSLTPFLPLEGGGVPKKRLVALEADNVDLIGFFELSLVQTSTCVRDGTFVLTTATSSNRTPTDNCSVYLIRRRR